jgi:hypothetical protein
MAQPVCPSFGIPGAFPHLRFGRYALSVVCGIDDVADLHALIADMAVMIGDHAEATIGLGIGHGPEPLVGRGAIDAPAYGAVGFNRLRMDRMVPEAHRARQSGRGAPSPPRPCA